MEKQNIDWANLGFGYMTTGERFVANYKDGNWDNGEMTTDATVTMNECAGVLQYAGSGACHRAGDCACRYRTAFAQIGKDGCCERKNDLH